MRGWKWVCVRACVDACARMCVRARACLPQVSEFDALEWVEAIVKATACNDVRSRLQLILREAKPARTAGAYRIAEEVGLRRCPSVPLERIPHARCEHAILPANSPPPQGSLSTLKRGSYSLKTISDSHQRLHSGRLGQNTHAANVAFCLFLCLFSQLLKFPTFWFLLVQSLTCW